MLSIFSSPVTYGENKRSHLYFTIAIIAIVAAGGFVLLEISDTITDLALIEDSFYVVTRNGEARLSAEISRGIQDINLDFFEENFNEIDKDIDSL